jgi:hypothetical protein
VRARRTAWKAVPTRDDFQFIFFRDHALARVELERQREAVAECLQPGRAEIIGEPACGRLRAGTAGHAAFALFVREPFDFAPQIGGGDFGGKSIRARSRGCCFIFPRPGFRFGDIGFFLRRLRAFRRRLDRGARGLVVPVGEKKL